MKLIGRTDVFSVSSLVALNRIIDDGQKREGGKCTSYLTNHSGYFASGVSIYGRSGILRRDSL